jgi:hypothetical protein
LSKNKEKLERDEKNLARIYLGEGFVTMTFQIFGPSLPSGWDLKTFSYAQCPLGSLNNISKDTLHGATESQ